MDRFEESEDFKFDKFIAQVYGMREPFLFEYIIICVDGVRLQ